MLCSAFPLVEHKSSFVNTIMTAEDLHYRVLSVDDDTEIHHTYRSIFGGDRRGTANESLANLLSELGEAPEEEEPAGPRFRIDSAHSGEEGVQYFEKAQAEGDPYVMVFMDVRMPPGIDGVEAATRIKAINPHVKIIIISAYSDYSEYDIRQQIGVDFHFLSKPFESFELMQLASLLIEQWEVSRELRDTNEKLSISVERERKASEAKEQFFAVMSHELRTPLSTIVSNSEFLAQQETDPEKRELIRSIEVAGRTQLSLVNDILDMSKIRSGKFTIDEGLYDLAQLLQDIEVLLSTRARQSGLDFSIDQQHQERFMLIGDGQRVGQILINLVSNAIKFTKQGSVRICCWVMGDALVFTVEDTGIGIPEEAIGRLFQRFEQVDKRISSRFGGSGLGLYISKQLADLMGGEIQVSSHIGVGSTFTLSLPYRPSETLVEVADRAHVAPTSDDGQFRGSVLVAEDTVELQKMEARILEKLGLEVTLAGNGLEAVELGGAKRYDLILMDMQMPVLDGIEAARALREKGIDTPIVALTAAVQPHHQIQFEQVGIQGVLLKPLNRRELSRCLKNVLIDSD